MQVYNHSNIYLSNFYLSQSHVNPQFKSAPKFNNARVNMEKKLEYSLRVSGNKMQDLLTPKSAKETLKDIAALVPQQNKTFLEQLAEIARLYATQNVVQINLEDNILEQIAEAGDSTIFIMNHSNQSEDPQMLAFLNTLLAEAYKKTGKESFPLPKIVMNEDILKTMNPIKRKVFENFGAVGIDASLMDANKGVNVRAFLPLMRDFIQDKCNIFIFPEGRLAVRKDLDLYSRFQDGVASLINKILGVKKQVRVVPVGFAYNPALQRKNIQIGTPIMVKRDNGATSVTKGDIEKDPECCLSNFFKKNEGVENVIITSEGIPVEPINIPIYLKTILSENLEINSNIAQEKVQKPLSSDIEIL